jgi:voltage-gated potassium channel
VNAGPNTEVLPGQPRSEADAAFLQRFDTIMRLPIIVSAILPLVIVPESGGWIGIVVGIVTWLVFLVDYVVHVRHLYRYRHTRLGRFDLVVVIATAPWFLLPGAQLGRFVVFLRLARLIRLVVATRGSRRLLERLGRVVLVALGIVFFGSLVAYYAEHPTNPEFATVGDALWWGIVTLTTVGYGDIVPKTPTGRWAGVMIMITGIAVLGTLAGSLSSFFRLDDSGGEPEPEGAVPTTDADPVLAALTAEVRALRDQLDRLAARISPPPQPATAEGAGEGDEADGG